MLSEAESALIKKPGINKWRMLVPTFPPTPRPRGQGESPSEKGIGRGIRRGRGAAPLGSRPSRRLPEVIKVRLQRHLGGRNARNVGHIV
jgi:hypothetical protein